MSVNFGDNIKRLRLEKNITQTQLANYLSVGRSTIAGYETKGKQPDFDKLIKLAVFFNVSIDSLLNHSVKNEITKEDSKNYTEDILHIDIEIQKLLNYLDTKSTFFNNKKIIQVQEIALKNSFHNTLKLLYQLNDLNNQ